MGKIFISYRSDDVPFGAAFIDEALSDHFGPDRVFRDSRSLRPGDEFDPEIMREVRESAAMLVLIGPGWVGRSDEQGSRKIDDPDDFIRRELVEAFKHGVWVIPVLMDTARLVPTDLPAELRRLASLQDRTVRAQESKADVAALIASLTETLPGIAKAEPEVAARSGHVIRADRVGAVFNEVVHVKRDLNIG